MTDPFAAPILAQVAFWLCAVVMLISALGVVLLRDVFRAAFALAASFVAVAAIYFLLNAEFIGVVQILVYVGAILIIVAFAVMFIRDIANGSGFRNMKWNVGSLVVASLFFVSIILVSAFAEWTRIESLSNPDAQAALVGVYVETASGNVVAADVDAQGATVGSFLSSVGPIGFLLIRDYVLVFEIAGFLIIAALTAGIVIMRASLEEDMTESQSDG